MQGESTGTSLKNSAPRSAGIAGPADELPDDALTQQLDLYAADVSHLYTELRRRTKDTSVLYEAATRVAAALDPDEVLACLLEAVNRLVHCASAAVYALPSDNEDGAVGDHQKPRLLGERSFASIGLELPDGEPSLTESPVMDAMLVLHAVGRAATNGQFVLAVPLIAAGTAFGALEVRLAQTPPSEHIRLAELLAASAGAALENARLRQEIERLATSDSLTSLSSYRHFMDVLEIEILRARRMGYPIGLLMLDLDHFKRVNDQHGHPAGDRALRQVAGVIRGELRRTDGIGRLTGASFGGILPNSAGEDVRLVADRIRQAVESLPPVSENPRDTRARTPLTVSIGAASLEAQSAAVDLLVARASQALYLAKIGGRNCVRLWSEERPPETHAPAKRAAYPQSMRGATGPVAAAPD